MTGGGQPLSTHGRLSAWLILAGVLMTAACTTAPPQDSVARFSAALDSTSSTMRAAYAVAQEVEATENRAVLAGKLACRVKGCLPVTTLEDTAPVLTAGLLDTQHQALAGLSAYADVLASLTNAKTAVLVSQSANKVGQSLKALSSGPKPDGLTALRVNPATVDRGVAAIGALGDFLVQERLNAALPEVIEQNHPTIATIAAYLEETIGKPGLGPQPSGIRGILQLKHDKISMNSAFLMEALRGDRTVDTLRLVEYSGKVYDDAQTRHIRTDAALAEVQAATRKMVTAHAALRTPASPGTFEQVQAFVGFAQRAEAAVERALGKP